MAKAKQKMTEEVKERLRAVQEARKGIATLSGYERSGLMACLDAVLNGEVAAFKSDYADPQAVHVATICVGGSLMDSLADSRFRWTFSRTNDDARGRRLVRWVRFKHAPADFVDMLKGVLPHLGIEEWVFAGPDAGRVKIQATLFPASAALSLVRAMWPAEGWSDKVSKYCHGYTAGAAKTRLPAKESGT